MKLTIACLASLLVVGAVLGDGYMQNPRGSNNKLNDNQQNTRNQERLFDSQLNAKGGYAWGPPMYYYEGSILSLEFTLQHACGNGNVNCELVFQYMCEDTAPLIRDGDAKGGDDARETYDLNDSDQSQVNIIRGRHESAQWYNDCHARERNKGLWIADQAVPNDRGATATRQNPGGQRHGTECAEERDYYPYWHPTPWRDIAVLTSNLTNCAMYQAESQNVKNKGLCSDVSLNNRAACTAASASWSESGRFGTDAPYCGGAPYQRDNHLGNGLNGYQASFNWTIPAFNGAVDDTKEECVLRMRYNISTDDVDTWSIDSSSNGVNSPITTNPTVDIGVGVPLKLAMNTNQYPRAFQDRSHVFEIRPRRTATPIGCNGIYNLNVRGRRGNIVQTFPATEYDFIPQRLVIPPSACVHFQWTGSDFNAANQAGEGTDRQDRSNIIQLRGNSLNGNFPEHIDSMTMWDRGWLGIDFVPVVQRMALLGQTDATLNDASPKYDGGIIAFTNVGAYNFFSTRNNNFTNRSQKGTLVITDGWSVAAFVALVIAGALLLSAAVAALFFSYAKHNPTGSAGQLAAKLRTGDFLKRKPKSEASTTAQPVAANWVVERKKDFNKE